MKPVTALALMLASVIFLACSSASPSSATATPTAASNPTLVPVALPTTSESTFETPTSVPTGAPPQSGVSGVATDLINVRGGPGLDYAVKSQLKEGDSITIIAKSADGLWWQFAGGWVSATYIKVSGDSANLPVGTPSP